MRTLWTSALATAPFRSRTPLDGEAHTTTARSLVAPGTVVARTARPEGAHDRKEPMPLSNIGAGHPTRHTPDGQRGRRALARRVALLGAIVLTSAVSAVGAAPGSAAAANGTLVQTLCADPATGIGVGGGLPSELVASSNNSRWDWAQANSRCPTSRLTGTDGVLMSASSGSYDVATYTQLQYRVPANLELRAGTIFRSLTNAIPYSTYRWGLIALNANYGFQPGNIWAEPRMQFEAGDWNVGNVDRRGDATTPFAAANRVDLTVSPTNGWTIIMACVANSTQCTFPSNGDIKYRIYGGKMTLFDGFDPTVSNVTGALATATTLTGPAAVEFTAADQGAGVYRAIVEVDGTVTSKEIVNSNGGRCQPIGADEYTFASAQPCKLSASFATTLDTSQLRDGQHAVKVRIEDATGNPATVVNRTIPTANTPINTAAPTIGGASTVRAGTVLTATTGTWERTPRAFTTEWLRCDAVGQRCVVITDNIDALSTPPRYVVRATDNYRTIRLRVKATNTGGTSPAVDSEPTTVVADEEGITEPAPAAVSEPRWTLESNVAAPRPGDVLTVVPGSWSGKSVGLTFRFKRCVSGTCSVLADGPAQSMTVRGTDVGATIVAEVTGSNGFGSLTKTTAATGAVLPVERSGGGPVEKDPRDSTTPPVIVPPNDGGGTQVVAVPNGECEGAAAQLTARFGAKASATVNWGRGATLTLTLVCLRTGKPISGAELAVATSITSGKKATAKVAKTDAKGVTRLKLPKGPTRAIAIGWRSDSLAQMYAATASAKLVVRSKVTMRASSARVRPGATVKLTGALAGAPAGIVLNVQALDGRRWRTFDQVRTGKRGGKFAYVYRFKRSRSGAAFKFRVATAPGQKKLATAPGSSKPTTVRIGG